MAKYDYSPKYERDFDKDTPKLLEYLFNGGNDQQKIKKMIKHGLNLIKLKYDCSDFRMEIFTRILYGYQNIIGKDIEDEIKKVIFEFPFEDLSTHSMCTWTENHQLISYVNEYLLGNKYKEDIFYNNIKGKDLAKGAYERLNTWCDFIYRFGFSEYGSNNYYPETLAAIGNLLEFGKDNLIKEKIKIVLDLLCYDIFSATTKDLTYNIATARAYADNKINFYNYLKPHISSLLGKEIKINHEREACFFLMLRAKEKDGKPIYKLPDVFLDIFYTKEKELKDSNGLDQNEYQREGILKNEDKNILYVMTSGTGSSYLTVKNVIPFLDKNKIWNHSMFVNLLPYRDLAKNNPILYHQKRKMQNIHLEDTPYGHGHTYTYVHNSYSLSSLTRYEVNKPSFQQVTHIANLDGLSVFTTSPAKDKNIIGSPNYWVGTKSNPDVIQHKNIMIVYYRKPELTHLYFPLEKFDSTNLDYMDKGYIFGSYHHNNIVIITNGKMFFGGSPEKDVSFKKDEKINNFNLIKYDLINDNKQEDHFYIFEIDDTLNFQDFIKKILKEKIQIKDKNIVYKEIKYSFLDICYYKNQIIPTKYPRFESKFIKHKKYVYSKEKPLIFVSNKHKLTIDFKKFTRKEENL